MSFKKIMQSATIAIAIVLASFSALTAGTPAALLLPVNNQTCLPNHLTLRWSSAPTKISNNVWLSTKSDFTENVQFFSNILVDTLDLSSLSFDKTYYWKAVSYFGATDSATSTISNFTVKTPSMALLAPAHNTFGVNLSTTFQWSVAQVTTYKYKLEVSETPAFTTGAATLVFDNLTSGSQAVNLPKNNTRYYWRVTTYNAAGCASDYSLVYSLRTKPAPVALLAPLDKSKGAPLFGEVPFNVNLKWNKNFATPTYQVQLADLRTFAQPLFDTTGVADTAIWVNNKLPNTSNRTYYWRVRAVYTDSSNSTTEWSNIYEFKTPYTKTQFVAPANNSTCVPLAAQFKWNRVDTLAQSYAIQLSSKVDFSDTLQQAKTGKDTAFTMMLEKPKFTYYARIRLEDDLNTSVWSSAIKFESAIAVPARIAPADSIKGALRQVSFKWNDFDTTAVYKLQVSELADFSTTVLSKDSLTVGEFVYTLPSYNKVYYWRYMATLGTCSSVWTKAYVIKTIMAPPVLKAPADTSVGLDLSVLLEWNKVETATYYEYQYDTTKAFTVPLGLTAVSSLQVRVNNLMENTKYFWTVRAVTPEGKTEWATPFSFKTNYKLPDAPYLLKPASSTYKLPTDLSFVWNKANRALTYDIQISAGVDFSTVAFEGKNLTDTTFAVKGLKNYINYKWRVRAKGLGGYGPWSDSFFRTIALIPQDQPALVVPAENAKDLTANVSFTWLPVTGAEYYQVQVAKNKAFADTDIIKDSKKVWSIPETIYDLPMSSTLYWRARAINEAGNGPWSIIRTFSTAYDAGVNELTANNYSVYPNPVQNKVYFNFNGSSFQLSVIDAIGIQVATLEGNDRGELNVSELPQGLYFFKATVGTKQLNGSFVISR